MKISKKGISLITLVVTIIVIMIIATVVILTLNENSPVGKAREATFKSDMKAIEEEYAMYVSNKSVESKGKFELETLNAGEEEIIYNTKEGNGGNIYEVIPSAKKKYKGEFEIIKGELYYKGSTEGKLIWAKEIGMKINPYVIVDGELKSANSNLLLLDSNGRVTIPVTVTKISAGVFNNLEGLKEVYIPGNVKEIGKNAFSNNKTLQKVVMEDGVEIIGTSAFNNCTSLVSVEMTDSVKKIDSYAFSVCNAIEEMILSNNITYMGVQVFSGCSKLKSINIPTSLNVLGSTIFLNCINLDNITIPKNIKSLEKGTFANCKNLNNIIIEDSEYLRFEDGVIYSKDYKTLFEVVGSVTEVYINENTEIINDYAFYSTKVKEIYISENIKSIGKEAALGSHKLEKLEVDEKNSVYSSYNNDLYDKNLEVLYKSNQTGEVTIKEGVKKIGEGCFLSSGVSKINLPSTLETIEGWNVFPTNIKDIYIPKNVKKIDNSSLTSLNNVEVDVNNSYFKSIDNKYLLSKDGKKLYWVSKTIKNVDDLPQSIEEITTYSFYKCSNLKEVDLHSGIKIIQDSSFMASGIETLEIQNSINSISNTAFREANNLNKIIIHKKQGEITGAPWGCVYGDRAIIYDE